MQHNLYATMQLLLNVPGTRGRSMGGHSDRVVTGSMPPIRSSYGEKDDFLTNQVEPHLEIAICCLYWTARNNRERHR
jgi:hypothetical protein